MITWILFLSTILEHDNFSVIGIKAALRVFHTSNSWWVFNRVLVTSSLLKSPGLFSVFWSILVMLYSGWSLLVFWFLSFLVPLTILRRLFQVYKLQLESLSPSCSIVCFFFSSLARSRYLSLSSLSLYFTLWFAWIVKNHYSTGSLFINGYH